MLAWGGVHRAIGLPASSSHTLIGSIIGVGIANQLMSVKTGTSGVDWAQAANIGKSLLLSPVVGFICAALDEEDGCAKVLDRRCGHPRQLQEAYRQRHE